MTTSDCCTPPVSLPTSRLGPAVRLGTDARAEADVFGLDRLAVPAVEIDCRVRPNIRLATADLLSYRSAWGRYGLVLDPIGAVTFASGKPRPWVMVQHFTGFPLTQFTIEAIVCPYREHSRLSILSYAALSDGRPHGLLVQERAEGLVLSINGQEISTGLHLDYHQWQHIVLTWRSSDGRFEFYKEDGVSAVAAMLERRVVDFAEPAFSGTIAVGDSLPADGCLVLGQEQGSPGLLTEFVPGSGFVGGFRTVRLWDRVLERAALNHHKAEWLEGNEPGLVGCWYFTRRGLEIGECLNACSATDNVGQIGGLTPAAMRDVQHYRPMVISVDRTMAGQRPLVASAWQQVSVVCKGQREGGPVEPSLTIDGRQVELRPVASEDAPPILPPHFRIGPMSGSLMAGLRLRGVGDDGVLAHYAGDLAADGRLHDCSGAAMHLSVTGEFVQEMIG